MKNRNITRPDCLKGRREEIARHDKPVGLRPKMHRSKKT